MAKKKNKKVVRYRRPLNINVGMIIFALIFLYMAFYLYTYLRRDKVEFYEVVEGNIVNDRQYTGIILRDERVENTDRAGYINYYIREGKSQIVIAIGCTGGNHRSVVFAEALKDYFSRKWDNVTVNHRDIDRK